MTRDTLLWLPARPNAGLPISTLTRWVREEGSLAALREACPDLRVAHVHGARHGLWWEFDLLCSYRWAQLLHRIPNEKFQRRLFKLAVELGILAVLDQPVAELTPAQRAKADLAMALLPRPDVLVWEEPFTHLGPDDQARVTGFVRHLNRVENLAVAAVGTQLSPLRAWNAGLRAVR